MVLFLFRYPLRLCLRICLQCCHCKSLCFLRKVRQTLRFSKLLSWYFVVWIHRVLVETGKEKPVHSWHDLLVNLCHPASLGTLNGQERSETGSLHSPCPQGALTTSGTFFLVSQLPSLEVFFMLFVSRNLKFSSDCNSFVWFYGTCEESQCGLSSWQLLFI